MKYIDLHCDTLSKAYKNRLNDIWSLPDAMADIQRLKEADVMAQFFAIYLPTAETDDFDKDDEYIIRLTEILKESIKGHNDVIEFASNIQTMSSNIKNSKISAFLTIEDGRSVNGEFNKIKEYYTAGVRLISLTWNSKNCFGYPNSYDNETMQKGLTRFGKEAIEYMNDLGIIVDVSHLSDGGFYDVAEISKRPFMASHSNCRTLSAHPRNLTDEMIKILSEKGGVMGLNFYSEFLKKNSNVSDIDSMVLHIKHMIDKGGIDCVAIGTDFDGIGGELEIGEPTGMHLLFERLIKEGIKGEQLEKIAYKNAYRVIKDTMK